MGELIFISNVIVMALLVFIAVIVMVILVFEFVGMFRK